MPTDKQRREAARRHLERQLARRQERDARRRKVPLISSVVGTIVLIVVVVVAVAVIGGSDSSPSSTADGAGATGGASSSTVASALPPTTAPTTAAPTTPAPTHYSAATGAAVSFKGVTVKGATDLAGYPVVSSHSTTDPSGIEVKDLVVGKGPAATPTSNVTVQYTGVLYRSGTEFDSSWSRGAPTAFSLTGVVPGFTQGIGGTKGVPPMHVGGRRIIILPASLGYGSQGAGGSIPPNSSLVFVVDLVKLG